jgi:transposase, IS5 family
MDGQLSFATLNYAGKKKRTKRDVFLAEMAATVPWSVLEAVIAPHYPQPVLKAAVERSRSR